MSAATAPEEDGKSGKPTVVSIKHTMSRVKAGGGGGAGGDGAAAGVSGAPPGETRVADGSRLKAALRASIESQTSSHEGAGELEDDDDEEDLDSPRNRGRQYDDRWKMPGHAESVLASFVERLEHRGHAIDGSGGGGGIPSGEMSAAAALQEARASRGVAVAVLGRNHRLQSERTTRNSPGPSFALADSGKKRRSAGGGRVGVKNGTGTGTGSRSRGKSGKTSPSGRRVSAGKGRTAAAAAVAANESGHKQLSAGGGGGGAGGVGGSGAWSKIASSIQRAAEAIVGVSKEPGEEEQQHRTEIDRTRNAVTAFLSSSSSRSQDQE